MWLNSKWYTEELRAEKMKKIQLERKYRSTKLEVDKEISLQNHPYHDSSYQEKLL